MDVVFKPCRCCRRGYRCVGICCRALQVQLGGMGGLHGRPDVGVHSELGFWLIDIHS